MRLWLTAVAVVSFSATAFADTTLLDIPSGYQHDITWQTETGGSGFASGSSDLPFSISSEFIAFSEDNWATPGNVYAWDWETYTNQVGTIFFDADEESLISLQAFDLSGFGDYSESAAWIRVFADEELIFEGDYYFDGNQGVDRVELDFGFASSYQVQIENIGVWASVGIDNIAVSSIAVPAPGVLALLGVAGLVGNRRRRTA